jgi:Protein of unknown function (DUF2721)
MEHSPVTDISQVIQLAVAPVFLLAGIGAFINAFAARLGRTFDRSRVLENRLEINDPEVHAAVESELAVLRRRARLSYFGIALGTLSALLVCLLIAVAFAGYFFGFESRQLMGGLFMAAMLCLIGGLVAFLQEISIAVRRLSIGRSVG